jgi:DNA helicase II / ATP-dependent DNA helicase PcrA
VEELPEANVRWLTPRNQAFGSGYAREYKQAWERGTGLGSMIGAGRVDTPAVPKAMQESRSATSSSGHKLRQGQSVFHTKFGEGVIMTLEGSGEEARAQVNFGRHGMKWLALSVAKLQPVD